MQNYKFKFEFTDYDEAKAALHLYRVSPPGDNFPGMPKFVIDNIEINPEDETEITFWLSLFRG